MDPLTLIFFIGWTGWLAVSHSEPEFWCRIVAAMALLWHPIHEQGLGFRRAFNLAVNGVSEKDLDVSPAHRNTEWRRRVMVTPIWPLGGRQNAVQFIALATVFPVAALVGPWWVVFGLVNFYGLDQWWTHARNRVPGFWSAFAGLVAAFAAFLFALPERVSGAEAALTLLSGLAGALLLAIPWWMAHRKVSAS